MNAGTVEAFKPAYFEYKSKLAAWQKRSDESFLPPAEREREDRAIRDAHAALRQRWPDIDGYERESKELSALDSEVRPLRRVLKPLRDERDAIGVRAEQPQLDWAAREAVRRRIEELDCLIAIVDLGPGAAGIFDLASFRPQGELAERLSIEGLRLDVRLGLAFRERQLRELRESVKARRERIETALTHLAAVLT
jgi:hypothetical protein